MTDGKRQEDATLLDVLVDGFEKNEVHRGFHWRELPMPDDGAAMRKFASLSDEASRWKGAPLRIENTSGRQLALWSDLEIRRAGRAVLVRVKAPHFDRWWHETTTWEGNPMQTIFDWIADEVGR